MDLITINEQAKYFFDNKKFDKALELLKSVPLPPSLIPNLAKCYYYLSQADKALELVLPLEKTLDLTIDIALYHNALGNHEKAYEIYSSIKEHDPRVKFNLGWHQLRNNIFKEGFSNLQFGAQCRAWGHEYIYIEQGKLNPSKRWNGSKTEHLLLILEGGLGDEMIFLRWANHLKFLCNKLTILCHPSLLRLLTNSGYNCEPFSLLSSIEYTAYAPAMSLPSIIDIKGPQDNVNFPYIESFSEKYIIKQLDMVANGRKKIGIRWRGNPEFEHDQFRNPPKESFLNLEKYGQLFSLQLEDTDTPIPNCSAIIKDWQDTYSIFKGLDLLVTSCTSTAHLAGAMGIKCIVIVPLVPYFVWASDDMPWYQDNITVIRQTKYNDWSDAMVMMEKKVLELL